ncbi:MAG: hypothetical protein K2F77_01640 [Muribaculaceae bacterium]|nr:hypothetical protein [Muribaculaceae bacterium]
MKAKYIISMCAVAMLGLTSCLETSVTDESFPNAGADVEAVGKEMSAKFSYDNGPQGSNKIRVFNNSGYACQLDYTVGKTILNCGEQNYVDVIVPFTGDLNFTAKLFYGGKFVDVAVPVHVDVLDQELPIEYQLLTNASAEGKTWQWWAEDNGDGTYTYAPETWGCFGSGGYGWSSTVPNWGAYGIGQADEWGGGVLTMDEYVKFDLDGGANVTVCYNDGTIKKGTFSLVWGAVPAKEALGWKGTIALDIPLPHQVPGIWCLAEPLDFFDIAMLDEDHMILIGHGPQNILCDPAWATGSTHWTFQVKK